MDDAGTTTSNPAGQLTISGRRHRRIGLSGRQVQSRETIEVLCPLASDDNNHNDNNQDKPDSIYPAHVQKKVSEGQDHESFPFGAPHWPRRPNPPESFAALTRSFHHVPTEIKRDSHPSHLATSIPPGKNPPGLCLRSKRMDCAPSPTVRSIAALFGKMIRKVIRAAARTTEDIKNRPNTEKQEKWGGLRGVERVAERACRENDDAVLLLCVMARGRGWMGLTLTYHRCNQHKEQPQSTVFSCDERIAYIGGSHLTSSKVSLENTLMVTTPTFLPPLFLTSDLTP